MIVVSVHFAFKIAHNRGHGCRDGNRGLKVLNSCDRDQRILRTGRRLERMREMASGSGTTKNTHKDNGQLPSCCKYTSKGILCSANPTRDEGLEPGGTQFGDGSEHGGGFSGRDDNSWVQTRRSVSPAPLVVQGHVMPPHVESANYGGHSPTRSGRCRGKEHAIIKGSGRGQFRGRGRESPVNRGWVMGRAKLGPVARGISDNNTAYGVHTHGISEDGFDVPASRNPRESYSPIAGPRKRGSDWNATANGDGQWALPHSIPCRGGGIDQTERYERFGNVSDQDQSRGELAAFPPVGNIHFPGRDRYEPSVREQNVQNCNLPTGRPTGETRSVCAQAKGKGTERKMLGIEGDRHDFTGNRGRGRGRNMGGRGAGASQRELVRTNSFGRLLVKILRHDADNLGLNIRSDGYVPVKDLLKLKVKTMEGYPLCNYTVDDVKEAVRNDNKRRLGLVEENGELLIRANQGHSVQAIDSEELLERISSAENIPVCVHGTYRKCLDSICSTGLKRMKRRHVHFARGLSKDGGVISGMRGDCDTLIYLDVEKALEDGMKIYLSQNGVILTEGFGGIVPSKYFAKIERWPSRELIDFQGK